MKLYMHTINNQPAEYDGKYMSFSFHQVRKFASSLKQIREEQKAYKEFRKENGWDDECLEYGYRLLHIPEDEL